ncbi:MAG: hypothetical protein LQ343_001022 [Gyalolechia ehrenbergii]|nr:MAG: hypothetical protein LQ343_001022 [Gyalolechia ehrenbergii]
MSLRSRFGRLLGRSSDSSPRASEEHPATQLECRDVHSEAGAYLSPVRELRHEPSLSPRKLHKAASTTFQAFSDSLRSKAQAFYSSPSPADVDFSGSPEPKTPKASTRRSAIWSSVRSRGSRSTHGRKSSPEPGPQTPAQIDLPSSGPAPRLDMDFPSSFLRDSNEDDNVTTPPSTPTKAISPSLTPKPAAITYYKPQKQWPSPHMHLRSLSLVKVSNPSLAVTQAFSDQSLSAVVGKDGTLEKPHQLIMHEIQEAAAEVVKKKPEAVEDQEANKEIFSEDAGYASDTESNTETITTSASTAGISVSRPSSSTKAPNGLGRVFESVAQSNEDFRGTFWPAGKVIKSSKRSSRSSTGNGPFPVVTGSSHGYVDPSTDSTVAHPRSDLSFEQVPDDGISEVSTSTLNFETACITSEAYEADTEADTSGLQTVSMGSRAAWAVARADRAKRYAALELEETNVDPSTDEGSELGAELTTLSVPHGQEPSGKVNEQVNLTHVEDRAPQKGLEVRSLQQNPSVNLLGPSGELNPDMSASSNIDRSANVSHNINAAPVVPMDEYIDDKTLRDKLLEGEYDFVLEETLDKQDPSSPKDRFLVTCQLNLEDPFEAAVASFGCPESALRKTIKWNDNNVANEGCDQPASSLRDPVEESSAWTTQDAAYSIPIPLPSVYAHTQRVHRALGLMNRVRRDLISKQGLKDEHRENGAKTTNIQADLSPSLQENKKNASQINEVLFGKYSGPSSTFESTPSVSTDNWEKPTIHYGAASSLGRGIARGRGTALGRRPRGRLIARGLISDTSELPILSDSDSCCSDDELSDGALKLKILMSDLSELSMLSDSSDSSPPHPPRPRLPRGRRRGRGSSRRSSSGVTKRQSSRAYGKLPSSGYRKHSRIGSNASASKQGGRSRTPSYASTSKNGNLDQTEWLEAHYRKLGEQIAQDSARDQPKEPRQRLADVSMVERRRELNRKASFEALCQFIYQCERESEAEEAKQSQEEGEEGYTSAMFQGK